MLDDLARRLACPVAGWEKAARMQRLFEGVSLTIAIQVARQLRLASRVREALADASSC